MEENDVFEYITSSYKDLIEKHSFNVERSEVLMLINKTCRLKFIYQNLDGLDLLFENEQVKINVDLLFNKYTTGSLSLLTDEEKKSNRNIYYQIDGYLDLLIKEGSFLLENNKEEINNFIDWKNLNEQRIFDNLSLK